MDWGKLGISLTVVLLGVASVAAVGVLFWVLATQLPYWVTVALIVTGVVVSYTRDVYKTL